MNDPNGPTHWMGRLHLFFQHNPSGPIHDQICWGHASSEDLVQWQDNPVALVPTPDGPDEAGCWSGCIVNDDGVATAVYTGASHRADTGAPPRESVCLAMSSDERLHHWTKIGTPVAHPPTGVSLLGFRDPFVFHHNGHRYAVLGSGERPGGKPLLLLYRCDDLTSWTFLGPLLDPDHQVAAKFAAADFWECPQLFQANGRWVLIVSLIVDKQANRVSYLVGDLITTSEGPRFVPTTGGRVDHGHDFYAPAILSLEGRTLLWGWTWEDRPDSDVLDAGWAGALTVTRELRISDEDALISNPVAEMSVLHYDERQHVLNGARSELTLPEGPIDLQIELSADEDGVVVLTLGNTIELDFDLLAGSALVRRQVHAEWRRDWDVSGRFESAGLSRPVRLIIDGSVTEIFVDNGPAFTERAYARGPLTLGMRGGPRSRCAVHVRRLMQPLGGVRVADAKAIPTTSDPPQESPGARSAI